MVGGAPVTEDWAKQIGADGYAPNAPEAVRVALELAGSERPTG
jgi:5-methyltetrahydrofolate--homocysteine methyltransferase